jgi:hypothetical protein
MSTGQLNNTLVAHDFWPSCHTCQHFTTCQQHPLHPSFPHRWQWGKDAVSFPEGELILCSWVGTTAVGKPHTGCTTYAVDRNSVQLLASHHLEYLRLEAEKAALDVILTRLERNPTWGAQDEATYAGGFARATRRSWGVRRRCALLLVTMSHGRRLSTANLVDAAAARQMPACGFRRVERRSISPGKNMVGRAASRTAGLVLRFWSFPIRGCP